MKPGVKNIIGKTIAGVLVKERGNTPRGQVFLVFTDGTYFEFFGTEGNIEGTSDLRHGTFDDVKAYMPSGTTAFEYPPP
jgi:hypothetical protein